MKNSINLLRPELVVASPLLSLPKVVSLWAAITLGFLVLIFTNQYKLNELGNQQTVLNAEVNQNLEVIKKLDDKIAHHTASPQLLSQLDNVKLLLINKEALHRQLTNTQNVFVSGFSSAMTELAESHHQDIRLQKIHIENTGLAFSGLARKPSAVPEWLAKLSKSKLLFGHSFEHFKIAENEQNVTEFSVSSHTTDGE